MGKKTKVGKGRLDKYYQLAKDQGYRARSAFKLVQLAKKFGFLENTRTVIDLCASPGGWSQVAAKHIRAGGKVIAVDLYPIRPIKSVVCIQSDITTQECRRLLKQEMQGGLAEVVLNDGAPNVTGTWMHDGFSQADLTLHACRLACDMLIPGGVFVTKVFRSDEYSALIWVFNQVFGRVEATKPLASRQVSAEIFVVCSNFLAPATIDPRLFDAKFVFEEQKQDLINSKTGKVVRDLSGLLRQQKKDGKRAKVGYEPGDDFRVNTIQDFFEAEAPAEILVSSHKLTLNPEYENLAKILEHRRTSPMLLSHLEDLKLCSKGELQQLINWRLKIVREWEAEEKVRMKAIKEMTTKAEHEEEVVDQTEAEIERLLKNQRQRERSEKKKNRELTKKEKYRKEISQTAIDVGTHDMELFSWNPDTAALLDEDEDSILPKRIRDLDSDSDADLMVDRDGPEDDFDRSEYVERLAEEADYLYESEKTDLQKKKALHEKKKKKETRKERVMALRAQEMSRLNTQVDKLAEEQFAAKEALASDDDEEDDDDVTKVTDKDFDQAALWYSQPEFMDLLSDEEEEDEPEFPDELDDSELTQFPLTDKQKKKEERKKLAAREERRKEKKDKALRREGIIVDEDDKKKVELVLPQEVLPLGQGSTPLEGMVQSEDPQANPPSSVHKRPESVDELAEIQALGSLMLQKKSRKEMIEGSFNRFTFDPEDDLPDWFLEDENEHMRQELPVTREVVQEYRQRLREINARPIRKVAEAKARKKKRMVKSLEEIRRKAQTMSDDPQSSGISKAKAMAKMISKSRRDAKRKTVTVVSRRSGGGKTKEKGRRTPKGAKTKVVDKRLKKDSRAEKRNIKLKKKTARPLKAKKGLRR